VQCPVLPQDLPNLVDAGRRATEEMLPALQVLLVRLPRLMVAGITVPKTAKGLALTTFLPTPTTFDSGLAKGCQIQEALRQAISLISRIARNH
jgi:hypothetical protein